MKKKRINIFDVAKKAGVSKSTVSLAMKGSPLLRRKTLLHVQSIAREMGYRPNMIFSIMGSGNKRKKNQANRLMIAFLHDNPGPNSREPSDFRFLPQIARDYGYGIDVFNLFNFKSAEQLEKILYHRGYAAVIIGRIINPKSVAYSLELKNFSVVSNTNTLWNNNFHRVSGDVFKAVQISWDKTYNAGYRKIGAAILKHNPEVPDDQLRLAAVLERQNHYAGQIEKIPPYLGKSGDNKAFLEWFHEYKPDAVIGFHIGQYYILKENIPAKIFNQIGFASLIVQTNDKWARPISGVIHQEKEVAQVTIFILDQEIRNRIQGKPQNVMHISLFPKWHKGKTLQPKIKLQAEM